MEVTYSLIDWPEAQRRVAAGTLADDLMDVDGDEDWIFDCYDNDDWCDSMMFMSAAAQAYQAMAPHLSETNRRHADASLGFVLAPKGPIDELGLNVEEYYLVLGPERVARIAQDFAQVDFAPFADLFEEHGRAAADDEDMAEFDDVVGYFDQWKILFAEAARLKRGVLCHAG